VTYHDHSELVLSKDEEASVNIHCYQFGDGDLRVAGHGVPLLILHGHGECRELLAVQIAGFSCSVRARALEGIGAVVKGVVMRVTRDGADSFSNRLARSNAILHLTLLIGPAGKFTTLHLYKSWQLGFIFFNVLF